MIITCSPGCAKGEQLRASEFFTSQLQVELLEAAAAGNTARIEELLTAGAKVNEAGTGGMTAALWALLNESKKGLACLLEHGADPNMQLAADGKSVVSMAAVHEDAWYLAEVLKYHGNPNLVNPHSSSTPIFDVIMSSRADRLMSDQVAILIEAGANLNYQDVRGKTPMMIAATANRYDLVYLMLTKGADPAIKNRWGLTIWDPIQHINMDPDSPRYQWKLKVIDYLRKKKVDGEKK
jgi:ankyrin repeat protein